MSLTASRASVDLTLLNKEDESFGRSTNLLTFVRFTIQAGSVSSMSRRSSIFKITQTYNSRVIIR